MKSQFGARQRAPVFGPAFSVKVVDINSAQGTFTGYGAVFNNLDANGDICEPGCFRVTLLEAKAKQRGPFLLPLLKMHDVNEPIGGVVSAKEDGHGLLIEAQIDTDMPTGKSVFSGLQRGYFSQLSIGYNTIRSSRDQKGIRHLLEVHLAEISVVTTGFAANELANADLASVKSRQEPEDDSWKRTRFGGIFPPPSPRNGPTFPEPPEKSAYMSDADWQRAQDEWATARFRALGAPSPAQTNKWNREDEFRREQDADLAARCRAGTASVSEMLAYNRATNWTPSGIPLTDDSARINDAYAAIRAKLEEANG